MALASALAAAGRSNGVTLFTRTRSRPSTTKIAVLGVAHFMTATGGEPMKRYGPKPFPYTEKRFGPHHALYDTPTKRFNENSKIIVVEGNIGINKTQFAQRLAKEFDIHFIQPVSQDDIFVFPKYDYDLREIDNYLPDEAAYYDVQKFYQDKDPSHGRAAMMQNDYMRLRWYQYSDAMLHLFNTGVGTVLPRSCYSDSVFCDSLFELGYIKKAAYDHITKVRMNAICDLWRPHLTIYLDAPVEKLLENIKKRARPEEQNSLVLNETYLRTLDKNYKEKFLPEMRTSGEVLMYDYTEMEDWEAIADDIERLVLDPIVEDDVKFSDWARHFTDDYNEFRMLHQDKLQMFNKYFKREFPWDSPEMLVPDNAKDGWEDIWSSHPFMEYAPGWNPRMGDNYMKMVFNLFASKSEVGTRSAGRPGYLCRTFGMDR